VAASPACVRRCASSNAACTASSGSGRWKLRAASVPPRGSSTAIAPPIVAPIARTISSSPRSSSSSRSSRRWLAMLRWSTSYWRFTSAVNAFSVMAMNGSSYGTSNTGSDASRAASSSAWGTRLW
jgi:hypothetical protein